MMYIKSVYIDHQVEQEARYSHGWMEGFLQVACICPSVHEPIEGGKSGMTSHGM